MVENRTNHPNENDPPFSSFATPTDSLLQRQVVLPPNRPGVLGVIGQFELLSLVGEGGMGMVYKARDVKSGEVVAIKLLRPKLAEHRAATHRFAKEARHMQLIRHPHILEVLATGVEKDLPYFVMPFLERGSLAQAINPQKPLASEQCLRLVRQVAEALSCAHSRGLTHRDLKPANVLLDDAGNARLTDFGLARTVFNDSFIDLANHHYEGTAPYMSPQLASGEAEDSRCDIYAFGCLLYELLTACAPYGGSSPKQIIEQILSGPPSPILRLRPDAPKGLVEVAEAAMARAHRDRYANMADVLEDVKRIEAGKAPLGPHPPVNVRRLWRKVSRPALASAGIAIVMFGGLLSYLRFNQQPRLDVVRTFAIPHVVSWSGALPGDWDGDGEKDILLAQEDKLLVVSSQGQQYRPIHLEETRTTGIVLSMVADITGDGLDEAFIAWANGSNAVLAAINRQGWPVRKFSFAGSLNVNFVWGTNQTVLRAVSIVDLDQDGRQELLATALSTWSKRPRGLCCFDLESTDLKWFFETAPFVTMLQTADLDGDGELEVVIGSNAPCNRNELADGTDDCHAYVYAVRADGQLLWRRQVGNYFCSAIPIGFMATNRTTLVMVASAWEHNQAHGDPEQGEVLELGATGEVTQRYNAGVQLISGLVSDLDGNGKQEICLTDRLGFLHVLDDGLKLRQKVLLATNRFTWVNLHLAAITSLNSSKPNLLLTSSKVWNRAAPVIGNSRENVDVNFYDDNEVLVLDSQYRLVARRTVAERWTQSPDLKLHVLVSSNRAAPQILVLSDKIEYMNLVQP